MIAQRPELNFLDDSSWLVHRYDDAADAFQFRHFPWDAREGVVFLSDEHLADQGDVRVLAANGLDAREIPQAPVHFIFHSAFCASTMLVRVLGSSSYSALSEPQVLNDIVGAIRRGQNGRDAARALDQSLALLSRPRPGTRAVIIKPSNLVNHLARAMLALRPGSRAIFLHAPLHIFLGSVARKGLWCRLWVRELLEYQLDLGMIDFGFVPKDYFRMSDLQVAALGWLAQHRIFTDIRGAAGGERLYFIDSETLTQSPEIALPAICAHLDPDIGERVVSAMLESAALRQHSKFGHAFSTGDRLRERAEAEAAHSDEISKVLAWAQELARHAGIALN